MLAHHGPRLPGTVIRDWPATPLRGVVEGFYGTPWSHEARLDQLDFCAAHKMNAYVYSPEDDYLRDKWREPYPARHLARLRGLVERAAARHVEFTYALSPGLSVHYGSHHDARALVRKLDSLWEIGVRSFSVPFDDISYTPWNHPGDEERFRTGGGAARRAEVLPQSCVCLSASSVPGGDSGYFQERVLDRVGSKWTVGVVNELGGGPRRFMDLKRALVTRTVHPVVPPHVEHELAPLGHSLLDDSWTPMDWALQHVHDIDKARDAYDARRVRMG